MKRCMLEPDIGVKKRGPESAPRSSPRFKPVISTPPTPKTHPQVKPQGLSKRTFSETTPKQDENTHLNTYNTLRLNAGGAPRVETEKTTPHKNYNANYPAEPTLYPRVKPATRPMPTAKKRPTP